MNYRLATLLARKAISADYSDPIDINVNKAISRIIVIYETVNGNQAYGDGHPARCVTNIDLYDGSDVHFSLSGVEAQAADFYHNRKEPANIVLYTNGMNSESIFNLNFGRWLWDDMLAYDPTKFDNPQLKVTIDVNAGGSLSSSGYLTILALMFDEKPITPQGFLMHKRIKQFTLADAAHEYTPMPTDFPYRMLFVRAQRYGIGPEYQIDTLKLDENTDTRVVVNNTMFECLRVLASLTPPYREWIIGPGTTTANYFYCTPCYWPAFGGANWRSASATGNVCFYVGDGGRFQEIQESAGPNWQALVEGWAPHGVLAIPFGLPREMDDWYNVANVGDLRLDIKGGASVGTSQTCEISLQQHRAYPTT